MKSKIAADHATARFTEVMNTPAEKVAGADIHIAAIKASSNWAVPAATDIQTGTNLWASETANVSASETLIASLEKQLATARGDQLANLRRWGQRRAGVLTAINVFCDGSKDKMLTWGVALAAAGVHVGASVPVHLEGMKSKKPGVASLRWWGTAKTPQGFLVQHATNPVDPTTYSAPIQCSKRSFQLLGQIPGATVHFRVLGVDSTLAGGQTAWTAWAVVVVGA